MYVYSSQGDPGKDLESRVLQICFVIEDFGINRTGIAIGNARRLFVLKVWRYFILDGLLIQNDATFKASMPLLAKFDIQKREIPCFCRFTKPDRFE